MHSEIRKKEGVATPATISRRGLLRTVALAVAAMPGAQATQTARAALPLPAPPVLEQLPPQLAPPQAARLARVLLQHSPVAGFQYHEGEDVWPYLRTGDALALVREPRNPYDARAVRLEWEGHKIGYVPARDNAAISQLLDRDECLDAVITQLRESSDPWERVEIAVRLTAAL